MKCVDLMDIKKGVKDGSLKCELTRDYIYLRDTETGEKIVLLEITMHDATTFTAEFLEALCKGVTQ